MEREVVMAEIEEVGSSWVVTEDWDWGGRKAAGTLWRSGDEERWKARFGFC